MGGQRRSPSREVSPAAGDHPISRIRMYVSRHRTDPVLPGILPGLSPDIFQDLFQGAEVLSHRGLTFGIASGPSSRSEADVGWRSHLLVSVVPPAAGSSR